MTITKPSGSLYIVATPIGNREDISQRALQTLARVQLIAAEDTRHSQLLLHHYQIATPLISLHEFNEIKRIDLITARLLSGEDVALISDAGTPLISDPGYRLVQAIQEAGLRVVPIPGACALVTALCAAGLPTDNFLFKGFLSAKNTERKRQLSELQHETATLIFYESPHRITKLCRDIADIFSSSRKLVVAKELTKTFETFYSASPEQVCAWLQADPNHQRGEFVVLLQGATRKLSSTNLDVARIVEILLAEIPGKQAVELAAKITGENKKTVYKIMLDIKNHLSPSTSLVDNLVDKKLDKQ